MYQNIKLNLVLSLPFIFPTEVRTNKTKSRYVVVFTVNVALWREKKSIESQTFGHRCYTG